MHDSLFRKLSDAEVVEFQEWARDEFMPDVEPNPLWHPVVREEWARLQAEHETPRRQIES